MTRLWVLSDLHLGNRVYEDHQRVFEHVPDADIAIVAGDISEDIEASAAWLGRFVRPHMPVVYVLDNHEHYGSAMSSSLARARIAVADNGITLLENDTVEIDGTRFIGATLWTDYELYGDPKSAMASAKIGLRDHSSIDLRDGDMERFRPIHARQRHFESREYIEGALAEDFAGETVVVTHHVPHPNSVAPEFQGDPLTPAFTSDL